MRFFIENRIDTSNFDLNLREFAGKDFVNIIELAARSGDTKIRPYHMLLACLRGEGKCYADQLFCQADIDPSTFKHILIKKVYKDNPLVRFTGIKEDFCEESFNLLSTLEEKMKFYQIETVNEQIFLYSILVHSGPDVEKILKMADLVIEDLLKIIDFDLKKFFNKLAPLTIFDNNCLILDKFDLYMQEALKKTCEVTSQTGYAKITLIHLFLALAINKKGITNKGLLTQGKKPDWVTENLMDFLKKPTADKKVILLEEAFMHKSVYSTMLKSSEIAASDELDIIGESQVLRALFSKDNPYPLSELASLKVNTEYIFRYAQDNKEPVMQLEADEKEPAEFSGLEERLNNKIIGQAPAVRRVIPLIKRFRFGLIRSGKPIGVFLFMGPSSVGKTQLAKEIAAALFGGGDEHMIFINMGGFKTDISVNRFIGAPPGYVGYGQGELTNGLRDKPDSVILLDEVEKANEKVFDVLLDLLSEGKINDPAGPVRDASHSLVIMTSNLAADKLSRIAGLYGLKDFGNEEKDREFNKEIREELSEFFRPEFINRIDEIIVFNRLNINDLKQIALQQINRLINDFRSQKGITIHINGIEEMAEYIAWYCSKHRQEEGGRGPGKIVDSWVCSKILEHLAGMERIPDTLAVTFLKGDEAIVFG